MNRALAGAGRLCSAQYGRHTGLGTSVKDVMLVPTWRRMVELTGHDELAATMLTLWDPPKFLPGCSQAALTRPPVLVRNYDYSPDLFEQVVYSSKFGDRR